MATLKYYENDQWALVGRLHEQDDLVPDSGGTIVGPFPLVVNNTTHYDDLTVKGSVLAQGVTTTYWGALDMDIVLSPGRTVDLHDGQAYDVKTSLRSDGAVTRYDVDGLVIQWAQVPIVLSRNDWRWAGTTYARPIAYRDREGTVFLQGQVFAVLPVEPSFDNNIIGTLPSGWRPPYRCQFSTFSTTGDSGVYAQVDVRPDGSIQYAEGPIIASGERLSLDGISYSTR